MINKIEEITTEPTEQAEKYNIQKNSGFSFGIIYIIFFFMLVMLRFSSSEADSPEARLAMLTQAESGDAFKQIIYITMFISFVALWIGLRGLSIPQCLTATQIILIFWIIASTFWSYEPSITFKRSIMMFILFSSTAIIVDLLGPQKSIDTLYNALAICLVMSWFVVLFVPSIGLHPPTEADVSIIGGWRGVFVHKNTSGAVIGMAAIIYFYYGIERGKAIDWILFIFSVAFVILSKAKTPLGILIISISVSLIYFICWRKQARRILFSVYLTLVSGAIFIIIIGEYDILYDIFSDPESFTGRIAIWEGALSFWSDHKFLGSGYSALWGASATPPIMLYAKYPFLEFIQHSHNGYIEILATTGLPGLLFATIAVVLTPLMQIFRMKGPNNMAERSALLGIILFGILENTMESQLFTRDREIWIIFFTAVLATQMLERAYNYKTSLNKAA